MPTNEHTATEQPTLNLPGDVAMPVLGFGTFQLKEDVAEQAVAHALNVGYRHVDTADMYGNHRGVGKAIRESAVAREEIFLVTKIWRDRLRHHDLLTDAERSLEELGTDYVDQLLIHWPNSDIPMEETFKAMHQLVRDGKARTIGVSNFTAAHLDRAFTASPQPIAANQVELHPYLAQPELREACRQRHVPVVAYRPIVMGKVSDDPVIAEIAGKHDRTPVQVTLRWILQLDMVAIPRSKSPEHIEQNLGALSFKLDDEDMQRISDLDRGEREIDPDFAEFDGPK